MLSSSCVNLAETCFCCCRNSPLVPSHPVVGRVAQPDGGDSLAYIWGNDLLHYLTNFIRMSLGFCREPVSPDAENPTAVHPTAAAAVSGLEVPCTYGNIVYCLNQGRIWLRVFFFKPLKCIIIKPVLIWIYKLVKSVVRNVKNNILRRLFIYSARSYFWILFKILFSYENKR